LRQMTIIFEHWHGLLQDNNKDRLTIELFNNLS